MNTNTTAKPFDSGPDEFERYALEECVKRQRFDRQVSVLVMPGEHCELATQFAKIGARVIVADLAERQHDIEGRILAAGRRDEISFSPCILPAPPEGMGSDHLDIICLRRSLCILPYEEARQVVRQLLQRLKIGGKLYLSVFGMHSELSEGYAGREQTINQRFARLDSPMAEKYGISVPICLYSERDLFMLLIEAGGSVLRTATTTYGNVKAVAVRV